MSAFPRMCELADYLRPQPVAGVLDRSGELTSCNNDVEVGTTYTLDIVLTKHLRDAGEKSISLDILSARISEFATTEEAARELYRILVDRAWKPEVIR